MKHKTRELEQRINRLLQGLRDAEPAHGLEQRILHAVRERAAGQRAGRRWLALLRLPQSHSVAAAVLVLALALGSASWWFRAQPSARHDAAGSAKQVQPPSPPDNLAPVPIAAGQSGMRSRPVAASERRAKLAREGRGPTAPAVVALANHPAPEPPLTDEERLLLRLSRRAAPEEFDVLNPDARDAQAKSDKAEFRKFFGPPPTGDSE